MSGHRAGCPGLPEAPDVRAKTPDVRAGGFSFWTEAPDFRAGGRMSGASWVAGCPGPGPGCPGCLRTLLCSLARGAGFPGWGPDVRGRPDGRGLGAGCLGPGR